MTSCISTRRRFIISLALFNCVMLAGVLTSAATVSAWAQEYNVRRDDGADRLSVSTPYYSVEHDLKQGGAIALIRLTHGRVTNQLIRSIETRIQTEDGAVLSDLRDGRPRVSERRDGPVVVIAVEGKLLGDRRDASSVGMKTVFEYHWGYIKIHKELTNSSDLRVGEVCVLDTAFTTNFSDYGYREGLTEDEGAPPFAFGSNRWGKLRTAADPAVRVSYVPRSALLADPGVEGWEWFVGSDLAQWDLQLTGRRGQGQFVLQCVPDRPGLQFSVSPFRRVDAAVPLPKRCIFDFYIGLPLIEGHALRPWLHTSFNRNRGDWVAEEQIQHWTESGIQTVHCHNDGDYYDDGLFWRDGSYPPYPDMGKFNGVIASCQRAGLRVATYFSNKELHPSTREYQEHGLEWGRMNRKDALQHNVFRGTNEFGAQMCLRSGWLDFLKFSIDRVLKNHALDGVYYDWNVALLCCNPLHEGKKAGEAAAGHWDIDELLNLMEWTRRRVGPNGLVIVHNTTTPMFTTENFADYVVANEWGYGAWKGDGPSLEQLPLEWSLVNARPRGVISYGQLNADSPKRLHRLFALEALLSGVTPWPVSSEAFELFASLKPLGNLERFRFADWRNQAVSLDNERCASAIYSRPGECYVLIGNLSKSSRDVRCLMHPEKLPCPLTTLRSVTVLGSSGVESPVSDVRSVVGEGLKLTVGADSALTVHLQE